MRASSTIHGDTKSKGDIVADIARVLKAEMDRQEVGFNELARRADLRPASVHDILSGKTPNPGILTVIAILNALGKSLAWLDRERKK